jgi:hypothetical protein
MVGTAKGSFQIGLSAKGMPAVKVTRPGEVLATQYEFHSEGEAEAWLSVHQERGTFDRSSDHPLEGPRETD